jgi:hypothetical protein
MREKSPPHARLAFRVGVVGHRPNRLQKADLAQMKDLIYQILLAVQLELKEFASSSLGAKLYSGEEPILRAVTPLAEGSDRIFAEQALRAELDYELCCPMPFHQQEFERDFLAPHALEVNSLERFRELLAQAKAKRGVTIFELDGDREHNAEAYGAAGRVVLSQSDLLVAVWDLEPAAGRGGTVETLHEAIRYGVPVLWISASSPHVWRVLRSEKDLECIKGVKLRAPEPASISDAVRSIVREEIALPPVPESAEQAGGPDNAVTAEKYFEEGQPRLHLAVLWKLFRDLVGSGRLKLPGLKVKDFEAELAANWPTAEGTTTSQWVNQRLLPHYAWSDKLADRYADAYRSTYIFIYLAAAFAVFLALLPMAAGWEAGKDAGQAFCVVGELFILLAIIGLLVWEKNRRWHRRWLAYRLLAELIRQLKCLLPLGGGPALPRIPDHLALFGDPGQTWMVWHLRAIARATGIPAAKVTPEYLGDCLDYLDTLVRGSDGQIGFHERNQARSEKLNHRLHMAALWMFGLTLSCIALHLSSHILSTFGIVLGRYEQMGSWLILASATLPAFGAAMGGISNQGEFARIAKRSRSMADLLRFHAQRIDSLKAQQASGKGEIRLAQVAEVAGRVTQLMVDEVVEWRVIFVDRPATAA